VTRRTAPIFARRRRRRARGAGWLLVTASVIAAALTAVLLSTAVLEGDEPAAADPPPVHVHALGVNPADRSLFIATHTGLFRLAPEAKRPQRIGDRHQDTMGFTVAGPDHFLGSGHPDVREARERGLPPLLGLIESRDAGETWTSVSLLGRADFHALRVRGRRIVGYDATNGRVMISADAGRSWRSSRPPESLVDLVLEPRSSRLLAAGESRLFVSADDGRNWKQREQGTGLLAWPRLDRLYLLDSGGRLWLSRDGGRRWRGRGQIGGRAAALLAVGAETLYAATHEGEIQYSVDGGRTWMTRSTP
jgi:photosystem II stability/assembly factor-like uncharacterized protein